MEECVEKYKFGCSRAKSALKITKKLKKLVFFSFQGQGQIQ